MSIPDNVHFGLGFGFKYQAMIALLIDTLFKEQKNVFEKGRIPKAYRDQFISQTSLKGLNTNINNFFDSVQKLFLVHKNNILDRYPDKFRLMIEGEHHHFEDINLFYNKGGKSAIIFYQVKGKDDKDSTHNDKPVMDALTNFTSNKNIQTLSNIYMFALTNKNVQNHFFPKGANEKNNLVQMVLDKLIKNHKKFNEIVRSKLILQYRDKIEQCSKTGTSIQWNLLDQEELVNHCKSKGIDESEIKKHNNYFESKFLHQVNTLNKIVGNLTVIPYLDHRVLFHFLKYLIKGDMNNELLRIELLSMDAKEVDKKEYAQELQKIGFEKKEIDQIKFSNNDNVKMGKIYV